MTKGIVAYRKAVNAVNEAMPAELLDRLRQLRLWHWTELQTVRKWQREKAEGLRRSLYPSSEWLEALAGQHLKAVQTLNDFFNEPGDTAERDATKQAEAK